MSRFSPDLICSARRHGTIYYSVVADDAEEPRMTPASNRTVSKGSRDEWHDGGGGKLRSVPIWRFLEAGVQDYQASRRLECSSITNSMVPFSSGINKMRKRMPFFSGRIRSGIAERLFLLLPEGLQSGFVLLGPCSQNFVGLNFPDNQPFQPRAGCRSVAVETKAAEKAQVRLENRVWNGPQK